MEIIAIAATTLDGYIAKLEEPGIAFTSEADKKWFPETIKEFPVKLMGSTTFEEAKEGILRSVKAGTTNRIIVLTRSPEKYAQYQQPGSLEFTDTTPKMIVEELKEQGYDKVAHLGGGQIYSLFLEAGLIDQLWITLEPLVFGKGIPLFSEETHKSFNLLGVENLSDNTLLLKYETVK